MNQFTPAGPALSDAFLGTIYRATAEEARRLSLSLTEADRARLAMFCNARAHLREHGRAIATACTPDSLTREGGHAGRMLLDQANAAPDKWGAATHTEKRVSLGGGTWLNARTASAR